MVATTNVTGSNPGPATETLPDTVQMPVGNIWKIGQFRINLTPASVATIASAAQNFAATGIGLLPTDTVIVTPTGFTAGVGVGGAAVFVNDQLTIQFVNPTAGALTPYAGPYIVTVLRPQPNWMPPAAGNQLDW